MVRTPVTEAEGNSNLDDAEKVVRYCGIVRPIAEMGTYSAKHWREVHNVISEAVEPLGFKLRLVSESDTSGVILTEIVGNLYEDEIVIVDVSGRNPNVMFELGMRLAFEKPAIIVMDDDTPFSFDISPVKHIRYPRTLRYGEIIKFKADVATAVLATLNASPEKRNYLQQFGPIKVTELGSQTVELNSLVQEITETKRLMLHLLHKSETSSRDTGRPNSPYGREHTEDELVSIIDVDLSQADRESFIQEITIFPAVTGFEETPTGVMIYIESTSFQQMTNTRNKIRQMARHYRTR